MICGKYLENMGNNHIRNIENMEKYEKCVETGKYNDLWEIPSGVIKHDHEKYTTYR